MAENTLKTHRQAQTHHTIGGNSTPNHQPRSPTATTGNNTSTRSLITTARARGNYHQTQPAHKEEPGTGGGVTPETTSSQPQKTQQPNHPAIYNARTPNKN